MTVNAHPLIGTWHLLSYAVHGSDGSVLEPMGSDPIGLGIYTSEGFVSAQLMRSGARLDDRKDYIAYAGRWTVEDDLVSHAVELALHDDWVGTTLVRTAEFRDGDLILRPPATRRGNTTFQASLTWRQESA